MSAGAVPSRSRRLLRLLPLALLVAGMAGVFLSGAYRSLSLERLLASRDWLEAEVVRAPGRALLVAYGVYVGAVVLSIPVSVFLTMICGFLFGWPTGALLAVLAATTGAVIVFVVARTALAAPLARMAGPGLKGLAAGFGRDAFSYVLALRLLPVVPFWVTNLAAALFGARLPVFAGATLIGIVPVCLTFAVTGSGIERVVAAHRNARAACLAQEGADCENALTLRDLLTPQLALALAGLGLLALLPILHRHLARRRTG